MPLQNHSKFCILKITLTILGETHSQIEHFVTVVLGRNSFTSQRSWSTDTQLQFILQRSHNCCVWQKQLYLSKILVNRHTTAVPILEIHFVDFNQASFETFVHRYNSFSLLCWVETALPVKDCGQQTHNCSSYFREVTLWILIK